jgi:hypothetical protein
MQVSSSGPLSDEESIQRAVRERLTGITVTDAEGYPDPEAVRAFARGYNPDPNFAKLLETAYQEIQSLSET